MKTFIYASVFISLFSFSANSAQKRQPSSLDLTLSNDLVFRDKTEFLFADMGKAEEFQGILELRDESSGDLRAMEIYKFARETEVKMSEKLCQKYVVEIFGDEDKRGIKLKNSVELFKTNVGDACGFQLADSYTRVRIPYRYAVVGFIHGNLRALVWNLYDSPSAQTKTKMQNFWKTLK